MCVYVRPCVSVCLCVFVSVCVCVLECVCMCVWYIYIYIFVFVYVFVCVCVCLINTWRNWSTLIQLLFVALLNLYKIRQGLVRGLV